MTLFQVAAVFLTLVAAAGWVNARWLRLPSAVAMLGAGLIAAGALQLLERVAPGAAEVRKAVGVVSHVDFPETVVGYMLAFLLFAGAMHVDLGELKRRRLLVWSLATGGVAISTALVGGGIWAAARLLGVDLPLIWALVFGALISPTDPVAVLSTVRGDALSARLKAVLQGEALFNDGVGIVVFLALLTFAVGGAASPGAAVLSVAVKAGGGLLFGLATSFVAIRAMKAIDDYAVEVAVSLALAATTYAAAEALRLSGPIAVVTAGLMTGDTGMRTAMSDLTQRYVRGFWTLVDEILNALLFFLLGLELLVLPLQGWGASLWIAAIPLVLAARFATVLPWGAYLHFHEEERGPSLILAWGGLHGALSLALAMSIPPGPYKPLLLSLTYAVVIFSIGVQGLTFNRLVAALGRLPHHHRRARRTPAR